MLAKTGGFNWLVAGLSEAYVVGNNSGRCETQESGPGLMKGFWATGISWNAR